MSQASECVIGSRTFLELQLGTSFALQRGQVLFRPPFFVLPGSDLFGSSRLPDLGRLIPTAGDNPLTVRGKGYTTNKTAVSLEREQFPTTDRLPHFGGV